MTVLATPTDLDRARVVTRSFEPCEGEVDAVLDLVEGSMPADLSGVLYRNGVHSLEVQGVQQMHPFDGEGMVSRFSFEGGRVHYRNRIVETREVLAERRAGRMLYRAFGTNRPGGFLQNAFRMRFKNAANTSVVHHAGRLLALWEAGLPHALDPKTLETHGRFDFDGDLSHPGPAIERLFSAEMPFSAHPALDPADGSLHNFGVLVGAPTKLVVYRVDAAGALAETTVVPLARASFVHDFVLTPSWRVFFLTPVRFDVPRALSGLATPVESLSQAPGAPTEILLVPREGPDRAARAVQIPAEPSFTFHWINGYEEDGRVIVDGCRMDAFPGGTVDMRDAETLAATRLPPPAPTRWTIDVAAAQVHERRLSDVALELPTVHPAFAQRRHRYAYGMVNPQPDGATVYSALGKLDCETGEMRTRDLGLDLAGEAMVVPRGEAEDDVHLLVVIYSAAHHRSDLLCLDGRDLSVEARWRLPHHHPPGFHGCFVPSSAA